MSHILKCCKCGKRRVCCFDYSAHNKYQYQFNLKWLHYCSKCGLEIQRKLEAEK